MSRWSGRALSLAAWVAVVAVGAALAWIVISRVGAGLVADPGPVRAPSAAPATGPTAGGSEPAVLQATWQGEAGVVTASCQASAISLVGAQPEDGDVVEVLDRGPDRLVVAFQGDDGPATVVARCRDGRPDFSVSGTAPESPPPNATPSGSGDEDQEKSPGTGDREPDDGSP